MPATIYTVTLNPAVDEALSIRSVQIGGTNRCAFNALDPGGKGINASRMIHRLGRRTVAFGFVAGVSGGFLEVALREEGVEHAFDPVEGFTRVNVMLYESETGARTRLYLPGPQCDESDYRRIVARLDVVARDTVVIFGGSLPPGMPQTTYRDLCALMHERGARCIVDASGEALRSVLEAKPLLVKPNVEEAEEVLGRRLATKRDVIAAAHQLRALGAQYAVVSRAEMGAVAAGPDWTYDVLPSSLHVTSAVGSGDSMTAGMAIAFNEGLGFEEALRLGSACGTATSMTTGTKLGDPAVVESLRSAVRIEKRTPAYASP